MTPDSRKIWQPLHPNVRDHLDPEYVKFHDEHAQYVKPDNLKIWDGTARTQPSLPFGGLPPVAVGGVQDFDVGNFRARVYTPNGTCPSRGWPVFVWYHGGGWAIGGLNDNADLCTIICQDAQCCVVVVDYRLAPETPFPGAVEDSIDALRWVASSPSELQHIDTSRIILGGTSAGANLAITTALSTVADNAELPSAKPSFPNAVRLSLLGLVLIVPVIDNSATIEGIWKRNAETAPWLTPARMEWYRKLYFTQGEERVAWDASPNLAPEALLRKLPRTWIAISDRDLLAPEAELFGEQLRALGVDTDVISIEGGTHSILTLGGKVKRAKKLLEDATNHVKQVLKK